MADKPWWRDPRGRPPDPYPYPRWWAIVGELWLVGLPLFMGILMLVNREWLLGALVLAFGVGMGVLVAWRWEVAHPPEPRLPPK
ncbi:MAG TPA: hypothetical protein VFJ85_10370 [Acidimicrobiales bacterium]|nr:hypothetical protein [Acidimicrobiales bacterium]